MTTNTPWTPGPWYFRPEEPSVENCDAGTGYIYTIADCGTSYVLTKEDQKANAQLIARAPEMAEALQWISDFCAEHPEWSDQAFDISTAEGEWLENVRAILARLPQKGGEK